MGTRRIPYLLGHQEIADLYGVARETPQLWRRRSLLGEPDLVISGNPYWLLPTVLALAETGDREVNPASLAEYKDRIPGGYSARDLGESPSLIGTQEVAWIFSKKAADIAQWHKRGTLAPPDLTLSGSPLWHLETILTDAKNHGRAISAEAVARIQSGEREQAKPRGRSHRTADSDQRLLAARIFLSTETASAVTFVRRILSAGHAVEIRPHQPDEPDRNSDSQTSPDSQERDDL